MGKMQVFLVDYTRDPEVKVGQMAAICYDASLEQEACIRRAAKCKDSGHLSTLRFAYATFNVRGISRICSHQIVRMAHAGILQQSQRYVDSSEITFIRPPALDAASDKLQTLWQKLEALSIGVYGEAMAEGIKKEDARFALLHSAETELNLCLNFQGWRDFLTNRLHPAAQWEIREVAERIRNHLVSIAPNIFGDFNGK